MICLQFSHNNHQNSFFIINLLQEEYNVNATIKWWITCYSAMKTAASYLVRKTKSFWESISGFVCNQKKKYFYSPVKFSLIFEIPANIWNYYCKTTSTATMQPNEVFNICKHFPIYAAERYIYILFEEINKCEYLHIELCMVFLHDFTTLNDTILPSYHWFSFAFNCIGWI